MYRMPRCAAASRPGSNLRRPSRMAASMSSVPTTASSVALTGNSTRRAWRRTAWGALRLAQKSQPSKGASGGQLKGQPALTSSAGSSAARERAAVDLAVPFSPRISTPPIAGLTALSARASFILSCPTMAVKGKVLSSDDWADLICAGVVDI